MFFNTKSVLRSKLSAEQIHDRLVGKHLQVHDMDFEIFEREGSLKIIPHAETVNDIKTLPITNLKFKSNGSSTDIVMKSHMRRIDEGGPTILVFFCLFLILGAAAFFFLGGKNYYLYSAILGGVGVLVLIIFMVKLNSGYYDYIRKIRKYVKSTIEVA
jgi:peptidyl-tRNA hydrolase